jgi:hypothetical protein
MFDTPGDIQREIAFSFTRLGRTEFEHSHRPSHFESRPLDAKHVTVNRIDLGPTPTSGLEALIPVSTIEQTTVTSHEVPDAIVMVYRDLLFPKITIAVIRWTLYTPDLYPPGVVLLHG